MFRPQLPPAPYDLEIEAAPAFVQPAHEEARVVLAGLPGLPSHLPGPAADNPVMRVHLDPGPPVRGDGAGAEKLLREAPRTLELASALILFGLASMFLGEVVFAEWFYFRYRRFYAYTLESRSVEWIYGLCVALLALWMLGLAWNLARGTSRRRDRGLFAPHALRLWGAIFAVLPVLLLVIAPHVIVHIHVLLGFWTAAAACFVLAARRSHPLPLEAASSAPAEAGPPAPIE